MSRSSFSVRTAVGDALALGVRRPVSVVVWGLTSLLCLAGALAILCWGFAGYDLLHPDETVSHEFFADMVRIQGASALINLATFGFTAILLAAVTRAGLAWRHGRSLAFMRIGMDELRVLVTQFALGTGLSFLLMPVMLIGFGIGLAVWPLEPAVRYSAIAATALALTAFVIWVALRVVLITPMTVAVSRFSFIEGWRITRGRVWRLLGVFLLSAVACLAATLLTLIAIALLVHFAGYASAIDLQAVQRGEWAEIVSGQLWDPEADWRGAGIVAAAGILPLAWLLGMTLALSYGPWASAYRQLAAGSDGGPAPTAEAPPPADAHPEPVTASESGPQAEAEPEAAPEAAPEPAAEAVTDAAPEPVAEDHAQAAVEAAPETAVEPEPAAAGHVQDAAEPIAPADEPHPVADAGEQDAVETPEDHHRG